MNGWLRLTNHSWPCSTGSGCPAARHSVAFLPASPQRLLKLCVYSFWRICSPAHSPKSGREANCWTEQADSGRSSTSMAPARQLANVPYPRRRICLPPSVGWMRSVLLATPGASVGKSSALAPSFHKPTPESRLGSFGNRGNGEYRKELASALGAIRRYLAANSLPQARAL